MGQAAREKSKLEMNANVCSLERATAEVRKARLWFALLCSSLDRWKYTGFMCAVSSVRASAWLAVRTESGREPAGMEKRTDKVCRSAAPVRVDCWAADERQRARSTLNAASAVSSAPRKVAAPSGVSSARSLPRAAAHWQQVFT